MAHWPQQSWLWCSRDTAKVIDVEYCLPATSSFGIDLRLDLLTIQRYIVMWLLSSALASLLVLARVSLATSSSGDSVLVLLDPSLDRESYSIFFGGLESMC